LRRCPRGGDLLLGDLNVENKELRPELKDDIDLLFDKIQKAKTDHLNHFCSILRGKLVELQTLAFDMESSQLALVKSRRPEMVRKWSK
jgi:hypothetical protein